MDWKYIVSVTPEDLTEEEKDSLYDTIAWFNPDSEELNLRKCLSLLKISQEVLKYKGEQVEILLHKLDELATQQGEEEVKKLESDTDGRSSKSRKSSSLEYENLEEKYQELKAKYKKQVRSNEKNQIELAKLQKRIVGLEQEKTHLANELQIASQDDNKSDVSETVKEQHEELIQTVHNKNKQISELLRDIESVENENVVLREKVVNLRDELSVSTKELSSLTDNLQASKIQQDELNEQIKKLSADNDNLQDEIRDILDSKRRFEQEMEEFTEEVNVRVDELKKIIDEKEKEVEDLRARHFQSSQHSSMASLPQEIEQTQVAHLGKILTEREHQLLEVKSQLQEAVKEMEIATKLIRKLKDDKKEIERTIVDLAESKKELKKQLKGSHERCQNLQDELTSAEKMIRSKDADIDEIVAGLKNEGRLDLSSNLEQIQKLKSENRVQEKQIINLVKTTNKLQESCDQFEHENEALRLKLGVTADEKIDTTCLSTKQKQVKRDISTMKRRINQLEEENLDLRVKIHKSMKAEPEESEVGNQTKLLVEENEALRLGLHEILDSVKHKQETSLKELKSETLEKLLRALDVKHICGWYHPAMRLQADLHNQEGINTELREQLRLARLESQSVRTASERSVDVADSNVAIIDLATINSIHRALQEIFVKLEDDSSTTVEVEAKLVFYQDNFEQIRQQISLLYEEYLSEKQSLIDKMSEYEERISDLEQTNAVNERQLSLLGQEFSGDGSLLKKSLELAEENVILERKRTFLENDLKRLNGQVVDLQKELASAQSVCLKKIHSLSRENKSLTTKLALFGNELKFAVAPETHAELRNNYENITVKYRELLNNFAQIERDKEFQLKMLEEMCANLQTDKAQLQSKILTTSEKLHSCQCPNRSEDVESLSKKLAASEANELSEKQRADHTNNLYELVKEQLQKSEDRFKQLDKYNTEILQKNLVLQEQLKDAENKLIGFVDTANFKALQNKYNELLQANETLNSTLAEKLQEAATIKDANEAISFWNGTREREFLELKHQIVDLQAESDEKMQIARLGSELSHYKMLENECKRKIESLALELQSCNVRCEELSVEVAKKTAEVLENEAEQKKKVNLLRELWIKSKLQYLGCVPLPSEEKIVDNIKRTINDKHQAFLNLYNSQITQNDSVTVKEQYENELKNVEDALKSLPDYDNFKEVMDGYREKKRLQFNETKYRRQCALKEVQLRHVFDRMKVQDEQIVKLEEELFGLHKNLTFDYDPEVSVMSPQAEKLAKVESNKAFKHKDVQTDDENLGGLNTEVVRLRNDLEAKEQIIQQLRSATNEVETNLNVARKQVADKQSQINFYERHILELQAKKDVVSTSDGREMNTNEEILALKCSLTTFQDNLKEKEDEILKYQSLLKEDRDKHSMAASLMRDELKVLERCLAEEKQKVSELKSSMTGVHPSKAALEQYFLQVQSLEDELSDSKTKLSSLESQLQASRQEAVRWRVLANDRLETMQKLGKDLEDLHRNEITAYKNEAEKWREEVTNLKQLISKYRSEMGHDFDFQKIIREKDDRIHELNRILRQTKKIVDRTDSESLTKVCELESTKEELLKEHEAIKKRFDQLLARERSAREEIRELRGKLLKKPVLSARSDKSEKSIKEQLQKKIQSLENEIAELKEGLSRQIAINESHKIKISEDFERWNKQKHFQQLSEKLKSKLKGKESDFEKLQDTCAGYRLLIERLEREKYNLESRIKNLKGTSAQRNAHEIEMLKLENMKLMAEVEALTSKLEMQHHHSGGLGAAMLQEKLEAQERKIAVLELTAKGTVEVRAELERLHNTISNLQKSNLCLEAENLELKLDLEKCTSELPHLREQVQHLENYIEVLKKENIDAGSTEPDANPKSETKKVAELERTIFILKRVVEKLQAENKRLLTGKRFYPDRSGDKLKRDYQRVKEQYCESAEKVIKLEEELQALKAAQNKPDNNSINVLTDELALVKEQLEQKTQLLAKVKVLLQRAAAKERALVQELDDLKEQTGNGNSGASS